MRLAAALCLFLLAAAPARADEFCARLKTIVRSAPDDFAAIRGPASGDGEVFRAPLSLPGAYGAPPCWVEAPGPWGPNTYLYRCQVDGGSRSAYRGAERLARRIMACLGRYATRSDIRLGSSQIQVTDAIIRLHTVPMLEGEGPDRLWLEITPLKYVSRGAK